MKNIVVANIGKRAFAAILDMILAFFIYIVFAQYVFTPIANASLGYDNAIADYSRYQIYSHLYIFVEYNENTKLYAPVKISEYNPDKTENYTSTDLWSLSNYNLSTTIDWTYYEGQVRYYYLSYLTGENLEKFDENLPDSDVRSPNYDKNVVVDGVDTGTLPKDYYTFEWYYSNILKISDESSPFALSENSIVLKEGKSNEDAYNYLTQMDYNVYYNAVYSLYYSDYFQVAITTINNGQMVAFIPPFFIALILVFLVPPLIFKDGATLCKKMLSIGLLNVKEYSVTRPQVLLRQLAFIAEMTLFYFIIPIIFSNYNENNVFSYLATMGLGCFILLIISLFNEKKRTLHDFVALTFIIDTKKSVWFDSAVQEDKSEAQLEENLAKYDKDEVISENLLQVGSTIIEENAQKVIEQNEIAEKNIEATSIKKANPESDSKDE